MTAAPLPSLFDHTARNQWLMDQLEAYRKAKHAASQARSQGAKYRRLADQAYGLLAHPLAVRQYQQEAEGHYSRAEALEQEAQQVFMAIAARIEP